MGTPLIEKRAVFSAPPDDIRGRIGDIMPELSSLPAIKENAMTKQIVVAINARTEIIPILFLFPLISSLMIVSIVPTP